MTVALVCLGYASRAGAGKPPVAVACGWTWVSADAKQASSRAEKHRMEDPRHHHVIEAWHGETAKPTVDGGVGRWG